MYRKVNKSKQLVMLFVISISLCCIMFTGCTDQEQPLQKVVIGLSWVHEAQFAGLYWADQHGIFEEYGLEVELVPYGYNDLVGKLMSRTYDFVILQTDSLLLARQQGYNVKAIFADYRLMPTVYYSWKQDNITRPSDLIGKTVGVAYTERYPLLAMLKEEDINTSLVTIVEREYDYGWLANKSYDVEAGWITDGYLVEDAIGEYNVIRPYEYGINWYADLIVTRNDMIQENNELVLNFLRATSIGWEEAIEQSNDAALLAKEYGATYSDEHLHFVFEVSIPLIHTGKDHIGWMEESVFKDTIEIFHEQGIITEPLNTYDVYTNQFLVEIYG